MNFLSQNKKLEKEIGLIEEDIYRLSAADKEQLYYNLLFKRIDLIRAEVLSLHLSFDDLLDSEISEVVYKTGRKKVHGKAAKLFRTSKLFRKILNEVHLLKFEKKLSLAKYLKILTPKEVSRLKILNTVRNGCSHIWWADSYVWKRRPKEIRGRKRPLIEYKGKNLFHTNVFLNDFLPDYGPLYYNILRRVLNL